MRALSLTGLLVLAACGSSIKPPAVGACKTDADCAAGQTCNRYGFCQHNLGCRVDADCGANKACQADAGTCLCLNDQGCPNGETCNASQRCQPTGLCQDNADCPSGKICSTANHLCIDAASCGGTVQCALGQICDTSRNVCVPGCLSSGDCPQTQVNAQGVTVFAPEGCINGQCQAGGCTSNAGCTFGQLCTNNTCVSGCATQPYCRQCDPNAPNCGDPANLCLIDPRNAATCMGLGGGCNYWCGIDCSQGQPCPSGFDCGTIVIVTPTTQCTCGTSCAGIGAGGPCQCGEGDTSGFCLCASDTDCDSAVTGATCQMGSCVLGKNCFPITGLYCNNPGPSCP